MREVERVRDTEVVGEPVFVIIVRVSVTVNVSVVEGVRVDPEFDPVNEANEYVLERVFV